MNFDAELFSNSFKAGLFEWWAARIFGKKTVTEDSGYILTVHNFRGKKYITDFKKVI